MLKSSRVGTSTPRALAYFSILAMLALVCSACGGGTAGTDNGGFTKISGSVKSTEGDPIDGATVTVEESGDSGLTDQGGSFSFLTVLNSPVVTLLVEKGPLQVSSVISDLPERPKEIKVQLQIDTEQNTIDVVEADVSSQPNIPPTALPSSMPTPEASPPGEGLPSASPSTDPTQESTSLPSASPSPTISPTPSASASSSPTPPASPPPTEPVTVTLTVKEMGYLMPFTYLNLSSGASYFTGDERTAIVQRVYPYGTSVIALPLKNHYGGNFATGNLLDILISGIAPGTTAIDVDLTTRVLFSSTLPSPPAYAYQIDHFNADSETGVLPTLTINPNVALSSAAASYKSFANGVRVVSNITFVPTSLQGQVSIGHAFIAGHPGAFTYQAPDGSQFGTVLNPGKKAPNSITLEVIGPSNSLETSIEVTGIPESRAVVEVDMIITNLDSSGEPGPFTAQITNQHVTSW